MHPMNDYFFSARPAYPWSVYPLGLPALGAVALVLVLFTVWTYLGHPQATRRRVLLVLVLRLLALAAALVTAARPSVGVNENPKQPSTLLVLVDTSESMTVKDEIGGQERGDAVRKAMERAQPLLDELLTDRSVGAVVYRFGPPDFNEATSRYDLATAFDAKRSDYGTALNRVHDRWQAERVRAVAVIGDGADNGETFTAISEAARFGRRGVPVHTFLVGKESSDAATRDVVVTGVECNPSPGFIKTDVTVTAKVNAYGYPGARVAARVFFDDQPKHTEEFTLERERGNDLKMTVKLPETKGEIKVKVQVGIETGDRLEPLPGELSPLNNWSETYLTVLKEGVRVLIVDQLRWEQTFVRDALRSEKRFDVYEVILQADQTVSRDARDLLNLEAQAYDVVVIGNVGAATLDRAAPRFLADLTKLATAKGVGVMFLGGEHAYKGMYESGALPLPIKTPTLVDSLDPDGNPLVLFPTVPNQNGLNKMFMLARRPLKPGETGDPLRNDWDALNGFYTGAPLNGYSRLELRPGKQDTVFAWTARFDPATKALTPNDPTALRAGTEFDPAIHEPLLVGSQRGDATKGRWLAFGAFDTYLWRGLGQPKERRGLDMHERFWRQCVLYLAHQDEEEGQAYARPQYRQLKVAAEQSIRVGVKRPDGTDDPTAPLAVRVLPLAPGQQEPKPEDERKAAAQTVLADKDGRKVLFRPPAPGEYFVSVTSPARKSDGSPEKNPDGSDKVHRGTAKFIAVPDISDEMLRVNADPQFLERLSVPNGGKALRLEELPGFLKELRAEAPVDLGKKPKYYPDWHRNRSRGFLPLWLVVFAVVLGAEWGLRRLWGLV
ncbi:MAG: vWA domain-containing protein [Gemmata sp.]